MGVNLSCDLKSSLSRDVKYEAVKCVLCDTQWEMCHPFLPFNDCACSTMLLSGTTTNPVSQSPLLLLWQTVPDASNF